MAVVVSTALRLTRRSVPAATAAEMLANLSGDSSMTCPPLSEMRQRH
jgi:hypothetical protein